MNFSTQATIDLVIGYHPPSAPHPNDPGGTSMPGTGGKLTLLKAQPMPLVGESTKGTQGLTRKAFLVTRLSLGFPGGSVIKESACNAGDPGSISGLGRSPGEGTYYPIQYSCLENSIDRGAWWATLHGVTKSWTWLSN